MALRIISVLATLAAVKPSLRRTQEHTFTEIVVEKGFGVQNINSEILNVLFAGSADAQACLTGKATSHAQGSAFFDDWTFMKDDEMHGAAQFVQRDQAMAEGIISAGGTAHIGMGAVGAQSKRKTVNIHTNKEAELCCSGNDLAPVLAILSVLFWLKVRRQRQNVLVSPTARSERLHVDSKGFALIKNAIVTQARRWKINFKQTSRKLEILRLRHQGKAEELSSLYNLLGKSIEKTRCRESELADLQLELQQLQRSRDSMIQDARLHHRIIAAQQQEILALKQASLAVGEEGVLGHGCEQCRRVDDGSNSSSTATAASDPGEVPSSCSDTDLPHESPPKDVSEQPDLFVWGHKRLRVSDAGTWKSQRRHHHGAKVESTAVRAADTGSKSTRRKPPIKRITAQTTGDKDTGGLLKKVFNLHKVNAVRQAQLAAQVELKEALKNAQEQRHEARMQAKRQVTLQTTRADFALLAYSLQLWKVTVLEARSSKAADDRCLCLRAAFTQGICLAAGKVGVVRELWWKATLFMHWHLQAKLGRLQAQEQRKQISGLAEPALAQRCFTFYASVLLLMEQSAAWVLSFRSKSVSTAKQAAARIVNAGQPLKITASNNDMCFALIVAVILAVFQSVVAKAPSAPSSSYMLQSLTPCTCAMFLSLAISIAYGCWASAKLADLRKCLEGCKREMAVATALKALEVRRFELALEMKTHEGAESESRANHLQLAVAMLEEVTKMAQVDAAEKDRYISQLQEGVQSGMASLELDAFRRCPDAEKDSLRRKLLCKYHPDKQPSDLHRRISMPIFQELEDKLWAG